MTTEEKAKWFDSAIRFVLDENIHLVMKSKKGDVITWAIQDNVTRKVFNSNMEWEDEPPVAKRDEAFLIRTRFSFENAVAQYEQYKMFAE